MSWDISIKINKHEMLHGAQRSWAHFVCICFRVCVVDKNWNIPNLSSMADDTITQAVLEFQDLLSMILPHMSATAFFHKQHTYVAGSDINNFLCWKPGGGGGVLRFELDRGVPLEPQNPYPSLRVI